MTSHSRRWQPLKLALVVVLGVAIGVAAYVGFLELNRPTARPAPGWLLLPDMPDGRGEIGAAVLDGRVFVIGGLAGLIAQPSSEVSIFDSASGSWSGGPPLPEPRHHVAATDLDTSIYVSGGASSVVDWQATDTVWVFDLATPVWRPMAPMPEGRYGHRMVSVGSRLYVVGGVASGSGQDADVLIYEPASDAWSRGAPLPVNRDHLSVVVVDDEIWAIGGRGGGINHSRVDIYDPATNTWRDGPPLPEATSGAVEAAIAGVVLISGGEDPSAGLVVDRHWWLDTATGAQDAWQTLEPPPFAVHGASGVVLRGRYLIVAGALRAAGESSTAWSGAAQLLRELP